MTTLYGYTTGYNDGDEMVINAPCGCGACDDEVQPGHFACSTAPARLVEAERQGVLVRSFGSGIWEWVVTRKGMRTTLPHN